MRASYIEQRGGGGGGGGLACQGLRRQASLSPAPDGRELCARPFASERIGLDSNDTSHHPLMHSISTLVAWPRDPANPRRSGVGFRERGADRERRASEGHLASGEAGLGLRGDGPRRDHGAAGVTVTLHKPRSMPVLPGNGGGRPADATRRRWRCWQGAGPGSAYALGYGFVQWMGESETPHIAPMSD